MVAWETTIQSKQSAVSCVRNLGTDLWAALSASVLASTELKALERLLSRLPSPALKLLLMLKPPIEISKQLSVVLEAPSEINTLDLTWNKVFRT